MIDWFLTHWSWLRFVQFIKNENRAHGGCDQSIGDAYSSMAPDPTSDIFRCPCTPILWFVFPIGLMRLITVRYFCHFIDWLGSNAVWQCAAHLAGVSVITNLHCYDLKCRGIFVTSLTTDSIFQCWGESSWSQQTCVVLMNDSLTLTSASSSNTLITWFTPKPGPTVTHPGHETYMYILIKSCRCTP
jgi:hypothetical protein